MENYYTVECPHCNGLILIAKNEVNCKIFRHAVYKKNFNPINPHANKEECDNLIKENKVFGCGKPFRVEYEENSLKSFRCKYI